MSQNKVVLKSCFPGYLVPAEKSNSHVFLWQIREGDITSLTCYYFANVAMKHHDQGNFSKEGLIWDSGCKGWVFHDKEEASILIGVGSWGLPSRSMSTKQRELTGNGWGFENSKATPNDFLPPVRPHLLSFPKQYHQPRPSIPIPVTTVVISHSNSHAILSFWRRMWLTKISEMAGWRVKAWGFSPRHQPLQGLSPSFSFPELNVVQWQPPRPTFLASQGFSDGRHTCGPGVRHHWNHLVKLLTQWP